ELVAQKPEQPKDDIGIAGGISHQLSWPKARLMLQQSVQNIRRVVQCARNDDAVKTGELVAGEVVIGDAALRVEVFAVGTGVQSSHRDDEAQPVRRGHFAAAKSLGERNPR